MGNQMIFKRVEKKYRLTEEKKDAFLAAVGDRLKADQYGNNAIRNLYYDTDSYELIRTSIEKPKYKEKLRMRGYGLVGPDSTIFLELKKKYKGTVYKRRISMNWDEANAFLQTGTLDGKFGQIGREIDYFMKHYSNPEPKVYLAYDRVAYKVPSDPELRITIDTNIRSRFAHMDLSDDSDCEIYEPGLYLMEIKTSGAYPLWLVQVLSELHIYPSSFSKYGSIYTKRFKEEKLCLPVF